MFPLFFDGFPSFFSWGSPWFFNGPPHSPIGFSFVFQRVPLCFPFVSDARPVFLYWFLLCFLIGSPLFSNAPFIFLLCSTSFSSGPSYVFYGFHYVSSGFPLFFYWVPHWFLTGSPLFSNSLISNGFPSLFYGPPLFSNGLSYVFCWVPVCFLMGSLHSSIVSSTGGLFSRRGACLVNGMLV